MAFYNLEKTQPGIAREFEDAIKGGFLPQSLLLSGPRGSSRLTASLDLAFTLLNDEGNRDLLKSNQIALLPSRNNLLEVKAAIAMFEKQRTTSSRIFLIQTIRKILLQYPAMLVDAYDKKVSSYFSTAEEIASLLYEYEEDREYTEKEIKALCSFLEKNVTQAFINKGRKSNGVTIDEIRAIQDWFSTGHDVKIAIIENLEESTEGAKNSLLKILEEPNENGYLILISSNPQRLLPTILSRVRKFAFPSLTEECITSFLRDQFKQYQNYTSFEAFFFEMGAEEESKKELEESVKLFSSAIINGSALDNSDKEKIFSFVDRINAFRYFIECVTANVSKEMKSGRIKPIKAREIMDVINKWILVSDTYNLSQRASLDSILRECINVK